MNILIQILLGWILSGNPNTTPAGFAWVNGSGVYVGTHATVNGHNRLGK